VPVIPEEKFVLSVHLSPNVRIGDEAVWSSAAVVKRINHELAKVTTIKKTTKIADFDNLTNP
jgi:hypothetical protein